MRCDRVRYDIFRMSMSCFWLMIEWMIYKHPPNYIYVYVFSLALNGYPIKLISIGGEQQWIDLFTETLEDSFAEYKFKQLINWKIWFLETHFWNSCAIFLMVQIIAHCFSHAIHCIHCSPSLSINTILVFARHKYLVSIYIRTDYWITTNIQCKFPNHTRFSIRQHFVSICYIVFVGSIYLRQAMHL